MNSPQLPIILLSVCLIASGCASLETRPVFVSANMAGVTTRKGAYDRLAQGRDTYLEQAKDLGAGQKYFDIPLIFAATAAAATLYYVGAGAVANVATGIGLGTGAWLAFRNYFDPAGRSSVYSAGADAIRCVLGAGVDLGRDDDEWKTKLQGQIDLTTAPLADAQVYLAGEYQDAADREAQAELRTAVEAAVAARKAGDSDIRVYDDATSILVDALGRIDRQVEQRVRRKPVDFAAVRDQIVASAKESADYATDKRDALRNAGAPVADTAKLAEAVATTDRASMRTIRRRLDLATGGILENLRGLPDEKAKVVECSSAI